MWSLQSLVISNTVWSLATVPSQGLVPLLQVGLAGVSQSVSGDDSPPVAARLSFEQNTTQSSTSPCNGQTQHPLQLLSLWDWYSQHNGLQLQQPDTAQLGTYVYAAEVESSASLLQGTCSLSGSFFQHSHVHDSPVAVYSSPQNTSCTEANSLAHVTPQKAKPDVVYARMLLDTATGKLRLTCLACCV